ncbi:MAG: 16S rRNA (cytosine(967)-C(5))-methyltransferase RsmB [Peptoanaerobacter stomatis]
MVNTRQVIYKILYDVKYDKKYSNITINETFKNVDLDYEMRGFITYIVYGVLSNINYLDYFIKKYSDIAFSKISKKAKLILEMAFFEIIFMNSSVNYASVNENVKLVKKYDNRAKSFVNAVLRKFTSDENNIKNAKNYEFSDIKEDIKYISTRYSVSDYIAQRLLDNYKNKFTEELLMSMSDTPNIFIRGNRLKTDIDDLKRNLQKLGNKFEIIDEENMIVSLKNFKDISKNDMYRNGFFSVQDYASMKAVLALSPEPFENVLDICAAPGGKSVFMAELMGNKGSITSLDISSKKLKLLEEQAKRLGINIIKTYVNDATIYKSEYKNKFDKVLCDVPCSGIGILRRKPEIRYKKFEDIQNIIDVQKQILKNTSLYLKKDGILVYSTCTLGKEENSDIISEFLSKNINFELIFQKEYYPHIDSTDGFFVCKMRKNEDC